MNNSCCNTATNDAADTNAKASDLTFRPAMDIYDLEDRYEVRVDLPGTTADAIDVTVHDGVLTLEATVPDRYRESITPLRAEYPVGHFRRRVRLGEDVDEDRLNATYLHGVLTLSLHKRAERQPRKVAVTTG